MSHGSSSRILDPYTTDLPANGGHDSDFARASAAGVACGRRCSCCGPYTEDDVAVRPASPADVSMKTGSSDGSAPADRVDRHAGDAVAVEVDESRDQLRRGPPGLSVGAHDLVRRLDR